MKKTAFVAAIAAVATLAAPMASAQTSRFAGMAVHGTVGVTDYSIGSAPVLRSDGANDFPETINKSGDTKGNVAFGLAYTAALNGNWTLGVALEGSPFKTTMGLGEGAEAPVQSKMDSHWELSIVPGYALDSSSLVYGKVGYAQAKVSNAFTGDLAATGVLGSLNNNTYKGWTIGAGYKRFFADRLYGFAEVNYTKYSKERIVTLVIFYADRDIKSLSANVGVGYQF